MPLLNRIQAPASGESQDGRSPKAHVPDQARYVPTSVGEGPAIRPASLPAPPDVWRQLRAWVLERVLAGITSPGTLVRDGATIAMIHDRFISVYGAAGVSLDNEQQRRMEQEILDEVLGFGPLEPLLSDGTITEIMVNGPRRVYIERGGRMVESDVLFDDDAHILRIIDRIIRPLGRHVDRKAPMADARLPDGSRVNIIIPPAALEGPTITIRKFSRKRLGTDDLIKFGTLTAGMVEFLKACVVGRLNILVSGGTGSGKTTLLNVLSGFIPDRERIVTIEDSAELQLPKPNLVRLESRPADADGSGRVTIRELVVNSLRMRPDRIVVGEVRDAAALDMLQAMNTGHDGSMTTLHANSARDAVRRLETMTLMSGIEFPVKVVREQVASALDVIIQEARLRDGSRKIVSITEVQGMEGDVVVLQEVFRFVEQGMDKDGNVVGEFQPAGIRPKFMPRIEAAGVSLSQEVFLPKVPGAAKRW